MELVAVLTKRKPLFVKRNLCSACGGRCCKSYPGIALPSDFKKPIAKSLRTALSSGRWAIDWWEGDPRVGRDKLSQVYFVRPAVFGKEGALTDASWGGRCTFLGENGCQLPLQERPTDCHELEPVKSLNWNNPECISHGKGKREKVVCWLRYQALIQEIINELQGEQ